MTAKPLVRHRHGERGQQFVEFCLVMLPLVLVLLATFEGARYMFIYGQIQDAARLGAKAAAEKCASLGVPSDSAVTTAGSKSLTSIGSPVTFQTAKAVDGVSNNTYVQVTSLTVFTPVVAIVPFTGVISQTARQYPIGGC